MMGVRVLLCTYEMKEQRAIFRMEVQCRNTRFVPLPVRTNCINFVSESFHKIAVMFGKDRE